MPVSMKPLPDLDVLRRTFSYDPDAGEVRYLRELPHLHQTTQTKYGGKIAGVRQDGRISISLCYAGVRYRMTAYRVGWALFHGADPYPFEIDHIDGDPSNDRIANLRVATRSENMRNTVGRPVKRSAEVKGVSFRKRGYEASICVQGKDKYLGRFRTLEAAEDAYKSAAELLHGRFAKHLSSQVGS